MHKADGNSLRDCKRRSFSHGIRFCHVEIDPSCRNSQYLLAVSLQLGINNDVRENRNRSSEDNLCAAGPFLPSEGESEREKSTSRNNLTVTNCLIAFLKNPLQNKLAAAT